METIWFCFIAFMIVMYVLLDGFDLGVGILHRFVARSDDERRIVLRSIGPVWDGNEVWLLATGGTLYFAFPLLYASSFSGFYLPLMMVLWLLMLRALSIELRNHLTGPIWRPAWDTIFVGASALLATFFGAALGNVIRGVPLDANGRFFAPMWIGPGHDIGVLDWYTVSVGLTALCALSVHGGAWLILKTSGPVQARSRRAVRTLWWALLVMTTVITAGTFVVQPVVLEHLRADPWRLLFPVIAVIGLGAIAWGVRRDNDDRTVFVASSLYLAGMLGAVVAGVYPYVLPAHPIENSLTIHNAAAPVGGLRLGLMWWIPGMVIAMGYFGWIYRSAPKKVSLDDAGY